MRIIKVDSCWHCPMKEEKDRYKEKFWCPVSKQMFDLLDCSKTNVPSWCELEEK